jgi:membrane-anchored protein YejM (alkaline phosphatase superfamily)
MAHDCCVVWQPDILGVVLVVFALRGPGLLLVDDECALYVDLHIAGVQYGLVDVALRSRPPRPRRYGA